jgi:hypothetical protein
VQPQPVIQKLSSSEETFLRAADGVVAPDWPKRPRPGCWSAGDLVAIGIIQKQPKPRPFYYRLAPANRASRNRRTTDELGGKEIRITERRGVRERTLAFLGGDTWT